MEIADVAKQAREGLKIFQAARRKRPGSIPNTGVAGCDGSSSTAAKGAPTRLFIE